VAADLAGPHGAEPRVRQRHRVADGPRAVRRGRPGVARAVLRHHRRQHHGDLDRGPAGDAPPDDKGRLWRTTDGGQSWTSIVGADPAHRLPNVSVYVVKYDPVTPTTIYAGTDLGVYFSTDDAATWKRMGDGFPIVPARDLYVAKNQDFIRVATFGRGLWEIYPSAANQGSPGNGDFDRNLRIDWIDLGAMAARLGTTPTGTTAPLYTWIMVITDRTDAPTQQIDDADLDALLSHFGGHP
jgi:hypothetical protein